MGALWSELRHAARRLAQRPGFAVVAVATLALGLGGATAIFSVADAVILRPLPYMDADRLSVVWQRDQKRDQPVLAISYPAFLHWRDQNRVFEELAGMGETNQGWTLTGRGEPVEITGRLVTANFFAALRVQPLVGRALQDADDRLGAVPVVVLSHALWRGRFSQDPEVIGQSLVLDGRPHTVVGVMPQAFAYPPEAQVSGPTGWDFPFIAEGQSEARARANPVVNLEAVSADYFRVMGIALLRGRAFEATDVEGRPGVVVVSESLARYAWPGQDPMGKRLKVPQWKSPYDEVWLEVVGVAADARYRALSATRLDLYMSDLQSDHRAGSVMVRTHADPATIAAGVREAVWSLDRNRAAPTVITMTSAVSEALAGARFATRVFGAFAVVALLLAGLGLYGLVAYSVATRSREIGVRVALGAGPREVASTVLSEGLRATGMGVGLGLVVAWAATRLLEALLFGVKPTDGFTFATVAGLLMTVSLLACALPLRRALAVDPAQALRQE